MDIEKGERWSIAVSSRLQESPVGIICVTPENLQSPWLHFEAGALASSRSDVRICVVLFEVSPSQVPDTLTQFQCTAFTEDEFAKLALSLNAASMRMGGARIPDEVVTAASSAAWPELFAVGQRLQKRSTFRPFPYPVGGETPYRGALRDIPKGALDRFHASARSRVDIVGHSLTGLFNENGGRDAILTALAHGATVRIVFLDPSAPHSDQLEQIGHASKANLALKITASIDAALALKRNLRSHLRRITRGIKDVDVEAAAARFQLAAGRLISYVHIQRVDDTLLVSHYSQSEDPGQRAPTEEFIDGEPFFSFYIREFERLWTAAVPVEELRATNGLIADRARVITHLPVLQAIYRSVALSTPTERLPPPRMFVVLPNMACALRCPSCFTWNTEHMKGRHMHEDLLLSIIRQARELGAGCIELTGGGEPLEHPLAPRFVDLVTSIKAPNLRVGVLSSGAVIRQKNDELLNSLLKLDYLRLGWTEAYDLNHERYLQEFLDSLRTIGERREKARSALRIGVKLLLTSQNSDRVVSVVGQLVDTHTSSGQAIVDHIKIKSIRGDGDIEPSSERVREFEHAMVSLRNRLHGRLNDLQIDVRSARVEDSYRCWISPLMTVIDASGNVYLCCNFYEHPEASKIGELGQRGENRLDSFWGGPRHRQVIREMEPEKVCNSTSGCHCRLVHYQRLVEPNLPYADRNPIGGGPLFEGHDQML